MFSMDDIQPAQTKWAFPIVLVPKKVRHASGLRRLPKNERSDDMGLVTNTVIGQMYLRVGRHYDVFDFGRKGQIWTCQNCRTG